MQKKELFVLVDKLKVSLTQLYSPMGVMVNHLGNVHVADNGNDRIMHWPTGAEEGNYCCWWKWKKK